MNNKDKECGPEGWINKDTWCQHCGDKVEKILNLKKTNAPLCSLDCEQKYWLNILG